MIKNKAQAAVSLGLITGVYSFRLNAIKQKSANFKCLLYDTLR